MNSLSSKNKICAVIPFYNEAKSLPKLIPEVEKYVDVIICVDDGSTDNSAQIAAQSNKVILIKNDKNFGKGYSLRRGFEMSIERGCDVTVSIDADLQHEPKFIPHFIDYIADKQVVIGNRLHNTSSMPIHRRASNRITSFMLQSKFGKPILDSQCGYRAFKNNILSCILPDSKGFEAETEMIIRALRKNIKIDFIPISTIYADEQSKMRNVQATIGFLKVFFTV